MLQQFIDSPIAATILVMTLITSIQAFRDPNLKFQLMFTPYRVAHRNEWYRIFSHGFIHADNMHLIFNMLVFYWFALPLEMDKGGYESLGHLQFLLLYLMGMFIATIPGMIQHKDNDTYFSLGASGAVSAVVLSMIILNPQMEMALIFLPIWMPGWVFGLLYIAYSFYASLRKKDNIAHDAHMWGALAGILLTVILRPDAAGKFIEWITT